MVSYDVPSADIDGVNFIATDLLDPVALRSAIAGLQPSHVFITTCIRVNSAMVRNRS